MDKAVAQFTKNALEEVRITLKEFKGYRLFDIRVYYDDSGEKKPSKKGITMKVDLFPELKEAILKLEEVLKAEGLAHPSSSPKP